MAELGLESTSPLRSPTTSYTDPVANSKEEDQDCGVLVEEELEVTGKKREQRDNTATDNDDNAAVIAAASAVEATTVTTVGASGPTEVGKVGVEETTQATDNLLVETEKLASTTINTETIDKQHQYQRQENGEEEDEDDDFMGDFMIMGEPPAQTGLSFWKQQEQLFAQQQQQQSFFVLQNQQPQQRQVEEKYSDRKQVSSVKATGSSGSKNDNLDAAWLEEMDKKHGHGSETDIAQTSIANAGKKLDADKDADTAKATEEETDNLTATEIKELYQAESGVEATDDDNLASSAAAASAGTSDSAEEGLTLVDTVRKAGVAVAGTLLTTTGLIMIPLPTPMGCVVAASGMSLLATEFEAANQVMENVTSSLEQHRDKLIETMESTIQDDGTSEQEEEIVIEHKQLDTTSASSGEAEQQQQQQQEQSMMDGDETSSHSHHSEKGQQHEKLTNNNKNEGLEVDKENYSRVPQLQQQQEQQQLREQQVDNPSRDRIRAMVEDESSQIIISVNADSYFDEEGREKDKHDTNSGMLSGFRQKLGVETRGFLATSVLPLLQKTKQFGSGGATAAQGEEANAWATTK